MDPTTSRQLVLMTGPLFLGSIFNWCLFGVLVVQIYDYFVAFHQTDRLFIKVIVYCVFIAEQLQTVVVTQAVWNGLVGERCSPTLFLDASALSASSPVLNGVVSATTQIFFAWRIRTLGRSPVFSTIALGITLIAILQCGSSIAVTIQYTLLNRDLTKVHQFYVTAATWLSASLACDLIIAVSMLYLLVRAKSRSSLRSTETLVNRLIVSSIETGTATAVVTCLELVFYLKYPGTTLYIMQLYVLGRVYSNVLLATLNGRRNATPEAIRSSTWASRLQTVTDLGGSSPSRVGEASIIGIYSPPHGDHGVMQNFAARGGRATC